MNKKNILIIFITSFLIFTLLLLRTTIKNIETYNYNNNVSFNSIISLIHDKYPNVTDEEIINSLNDQNNNEDIIKKYGISSYESANLNNKYLVEQYIISIIIILIIYCLILILFLLFIYKKNKDNLNKLTNYVEEINKKNYTLDILSNNEDEISILQNEIYKTMVMLKESVIKENEDKIKLKDSLSNISHQLKTPLTSINIALDNIVSTPNMDDNTRNNFYHTIQREVNNINSLVLNLLKLSKFDADVIEFKNKNYYFKDIIYSSIERVELIADLKNITFNVDVDEKIKIKCDKMWEVEAIGNILKNAIEHSDEDKSIDIILLDRELYYELNIIDHGCGISQKDLPNIFNRFYKSAHASKDSVGIGLSLAKIIIEKNNGIIKVKSVEGKGTSFQIKYYK